MVYITYLVPPHCRQISFEEILSGVTNVEALKIGDNSTTRTCLCNSTPKKLRDMIDVNTMINQLSAFNQKYAALASVSDRHTLYHTFPIPKKTGGLRIINAPEPALMDALRELKDILSGFMIADHHTAAFAYVNGRSTVDAVKKHQRAESNWFGKFDFHGFFPSTTIKFVEQQFSMIYPFNLIYMYTNGSAQLHKALELCFLDGGLPQGTPISPFITNVMMIPFDHKMLKHLNQFPAGFQKDGNDVTDKLTYTRYADDITVSCKVEFKIKDVQKFIVDTLSEMGAPFTLNESKTHYGSRSGRNWILGVMLNKDNEITPGHRTMKYFKAMITNYLQDKKNGKNWPLEDVQHFNGNISYYLMVERKTVEYIITTYNNKFKMDLMSCIRADLDPSM